MSNAISMLIAREHIADLRRDADKVRVLPVAPNDGPELSIETRLARPEETSIARRLAALDDARPLNGAVMLALVDGEAVAAMSLSDNRIVANPFLPTSEAVAVLHLRGDHRSSDVQEREHGLRALFHPTAA